MVRSSCEKLINHALEQQTILCGLTALVEPYASNNVATVLSNLIGIIR